MADHITVKSTIPTKPDGGNPVVLYETHEDHPDGEAFVAGPAPVEVARTPLVHRLIADGTLEEVGSKAGDDEAPALRAGRRRRSADQPDATDADQPDAPDADHPEG